MIVVSDTSPLNYLILTGSIDVLPRIFGEVFAPASVVLELGHPGSPEPVRRWAASPPTWLNVREPAVIDVSLDLGSGETAAIALAEELRADRILIDERDGRDVARRRGLALVGTLGVLDRAAELDLIDLPQVIQQLKATSFRAREDLIQAVLQIDQERKLARGRERDRDRAKDGTP